eukprot:CAMPEP_0202908834 /NCGR_PEP_ID=MMETSP1392-20130828/47336_1 /ASSEMBLY_ACC=CAM_ASM_000868 /TAXON_ID=225041 /ORGANISM="Chlamydomonas chlamydogama, Strain SAG 11-48b" /LENGTH=216 /DNA_ID=CAMNT_0049598343 /DNA_START=112 /DNA_END=759 /DNA_ORIENTATION=-
MADDLDLEEELLAVAGHNRNAEPSRKRSRGKHASSDSEEDNEDLFGPGSDDDDRGGRDRGRKGRSSQGSKKPRASGRSNADDGDYDNDEDGGYGSDLYIDDNDRRKLEAMTELEREMILAERAEERDKQRQRKELLKKAKDTDKGDGRSAPTSSNYRLSSRQRKAAADKDSAIRRIEAARQRQERQAGAKGRGKGRKGSARDWSESDDEGRDDDDE